MKLPLSPLTLFDSLPVGMAVVDRQGKALAVNRALIEFFACDANELLGQRLITAFTFPTDAARDADFFLELLDGRRTRYRLEKRYQCADGAVRWGSVNVALAPKSTEDEECILCTIEDVTHRLTMAARREREAKLDAMARFAAEILQRLNHVMVATLGSSQLFLSETPPDDSYRDLVLTVRDAIERTLSVNRHLVDFCARQVGTLDFIDLNALLTRVRPRLRAMLGNDVQLVMTFHPSLPHIKADAAQLERALSVLVANAKDAMPSGGCVTISTSVKVLGDNAAGSGDEPDTYVTLSVADTGHGMDTKALDRVFEPFFTTREGKEGAGLNLATVHGMLRHYGGFIDVVSEPGRGTTFHLHLPQTTDTVPELTVPAALAETSHELETVLLIEGDDATRARFRGMLRGEGFNVLEARYVGDALLLCLRHPGAIHFVLSELTLHFSPRDLMDQVSALRPQARIAFIADAQEDVASLVGMAMVDRAVTATALARTLRSAALASAKAP